METKPLHPGLRSLPVPGGQLLQGGADAVRAVKADAQVIVNCARRTGEPKVESRPGQDIYWLPMTEANMQDACRSYLEEYGERLLEHLRSGHLIAVHCDLVVKKDCIDQWRWPNNFKALPS
ncbi:unnamed protein product [Durusdinium trenchii]|uniref:Protein-tyrosine-phosphatase n=1 Tax=Durusdinium trenchii TaxID=1381693 RepID=A0ABP0QLA4_9DINO